MYFARSGMEEEEEYICMQYFACPLAVHFYRFCTIKMHYFSDPFNL